MTNSDDNFERVSRYAKKISNSELDREKRFRAIDQLRDFIKEQLKFENRNRLSFMKILDFARFSSMFSTMQSVNSQNPKKRLHISI